MRKDYFPLDGRDNEKWSPDGRSIAFTSSVYPDCAEDACNGRATTPRKKESESARVRSSALSPLERTGTMANAATFL